MNFVVPSKTLVLGFCVLANNCYLNPECATLFTAWISGFNLRRKPMANTFTPPKKTKVFFSGLVGRSAQPGQPPQTPDAVLKFECACAVHIADEAFGGSHLGPLGISDLQNVLGL